MSSNYGDIFINDNHRFKYILHLRHYISVTFQYRLCVLADIKCIVFLYCFQVYATGKVYTAYFRGMSFFFFRTLKICQDLYQIVGIFCRSQGGLSINMPSHPSPRHPVTLSPSHPASCLLPPASCHPVTLPPASCLLPLPDNCNKKTLNDRQGKKSRDYRKNASAPNGRVHTTFLKRYWLGLSFWRCQSVKQDLETKIFRISGKKNNEPNSNQQKN